MEKYIPIEELEVGEAYHVDGRNFSIAIWDGEKFWGVRYKWGDKFMSEELHYDAHKKYGTVKPLKRLKIN